MADRATFVHKLIEIAAALEHFFFGIMETFERDEIVGFHIE